LAPRDQRASDEEDHEMSQTGTARSSRFTAPAPSTLDRQIRRERLRDTQTYRAFVTAHPEIIDDEGLLTLLALAADAPEAGLSLVDLQEALAAGYSGARTRQ
jgi:hypothetical protein